MENRKVYMYVFDTMSDWEVGYLTAELNTGRYFKKGIEPVKIVTVGSDKNLITTMGGLKVLPDITVEECSLKGRDVLILPGGETWTSKGNELVLSKAKDALEKGCIVAAICGATFALAKEGILDNRKHTSNDLDFLKMVVPSYTGENHYKKEVSVRDANLITSSGIAPLEFTVEVLRAMEVLEDDALNSWLNLYKTTDSKYFFELMNCNK